MTLDEIKADEPVTMTAGLVRLFAAAGCKPTVCHACERRIKAGMIFRLVAHKGTDEMCCDRCGAPELLKRDKRTEEFNRAMRPRRGLGEFWAGYSRPSAAGNP